MQIAAKKICDVSNLYTYDAGVALPSVCSVFQLCLGMSVYEGKLFKHHAILG